MGSVAKKRLVIDATVMHSAGGWDASSPVSKLCRDFLMAVRTVCHRAVMTTEIREEWVRHTSSFSTTWWVSMVNLRKQFLAAPAGVPALDQHLQAGVVQEGIRLAMLKDKRLVEAALATDKIVISLDEKVRHHFGAAVGAVPDLKHIMWVNPGVEAEQAIAWLQDGARVERGRRLGSRSSVR